MVIRVLRGITPASVGAVLVLAAGMLALPGSAAAAPSTSPTTGPARADLAVEGPTLADGNVVIVVVDDGPSSARLTAKLVVDITGQVTLQLPSSCGRNGQRVTCTTQVSADHNRAQIVLHVTANAGPVGMTATVSAPPGVDLDPGNNSSSGDSPWFTTTPTSSTTGGPTTSQQSATSRPSSTHPSQTPASSASDTASATDSTNPSSDAPASATDSSSPSAVAATDGAPAPLHVAAVAQDGAMPLLTAGVVFVLLLMAGLALTLRHRNRMEARSAGAAAQDPPQDK